MAVPGEEHDLSPGGLVTIQPRRSTSDPVELCAEHAQAVTAEVARQVNALLRPSPNRNRSNMAMASEDLGDAED